MPTGLCRLLGGAVPLIGLLVAVLPVASEPCKEGQCTTLPEQPRRDAGGLSLMQSGRSVMPSMDTKLLSLDYNDNLVDELATMEDEFDDGSVEVQMASEIQTALSKEGAADAQDIDSAPVLNHISNPCLYIETILVIAVFAFAAQGFKWVSTHKSKPATKTVASPPAETGKTESTEPVPIIVQGGSKNFAALEQAVRAGDEAKCIQLLKQGGRWAVRQEDACGCTALHVAAHCGSAVMASLLLNHGAKVDACEAWEETPLHIAARSGSVKVCEILLDHDANIDAANAHGMTPLLLAGHAKQEAICELLLSRGAGAGGIPDTELPPLVNALLFRRMFAGAGPRPVAEVRSDDAHSEPATEVTDVVSEEHYEE